MLGVSKAPETEVHEAGGRERRGWNKALDQLPGTGNSIITVTGYGIITW